MSAFRLLALLLVCLSCSPARANEAQGIAETIERIKPSIVVVGVYNKLASPPFRCGAPASWSGVAIRWQPMPMSYPKPPILKPA